MKFRIDARKLGIMMIIAGAVLILAAAAIFAMYDRQEWEAEANAETLLQQVHMQMETNQNPLADICNVEDRLSEFNLAYCEPMGILQIEKLGFELPVLEDWSYQFLTIAPCRYSGSVEERNLILLGHNYDRHFGTLKTLEIGNEIRFYDMENQEYCYQVGEIEILESTQLEDLVTSGYDLSLFTCTPGGQRRVVVRAALLSINGIRI